ncbi:MAG: PLDc N-terminal domain-containing protein, partial [Pseudomonadota bacterium]
MILTVVVPVVTLGFLVASLWAAWRAIRTARTPQGAVGWVVFLLTAPHIALVLYLFLG